MPICSTFVTRGYILNSSYRVLVLDYLLMNIDIIEPFNRLRLTTGSSTSAIHSDGQKLYVGLTNGDLIVYLRKAGEVRKDGGSNELEISSTFKNVTENNSQIDRISTLPYFPDNSKVLMAISSIEAIRIYEIVGSTINLVLKLPSTRYASDYLYVQNRILVANKKKIVIFQISNKTRNILQCKEEVEISVKDKIKTLGLFLQGTESNGIQVLVALINDFVLLNMEDFSVNPLPVDETSIYNFNHSTSFGYFGLTAVPKIWVLNINPSKVLLVKETQAVLLENDTTSASIIITPSPIKFTAVPLYISYISPLYLFIVYDKRIEIIDIESGDLIQRFPHHIKNQIFACQLNHHIYITSNLELLLYRILDYQKQIDQYLSISGKGSSTKSLKDPHNDLKIIGLEKSISLVSNLDVESEFFSSIDPLKKKQLILRELYKKKAIILFESYSKYHESLVEICSEWLISYIDVLALFPDFLNAEQQIIRHGDFPKNDETESVRSFSHNIIKRVSLDDILGAKLSNTTESGTEVEGNDTQSSRSTRPPGSPTKKSFQNLQGYSKSQNIRKFTKAVNNLIVYLTEQRRIHLNFLDSSIVKWKGIEINPFDIYPTIMKPNIRSYLHHAAAVIDTSLFLCYFHTKPMLLGPLLRIPNNRCNSKVVNECLLRDIHNHVQQKSMQQPNFLKELLDFYYGRSLHKDALEMLYRLSHEDTNDSTPHNDSDDEYDNFVKGPDLTIQYLQKLTQEELDLVFQFSYWILLEESNIDKVIKNGELIFMNDSYECESYDNFKVLNYFVDVLKLDLLGIRYLEWLLFESDLVEKLTKKKSILKFHTKLCLLYLKQLKGIKVDENFDTSTYYTKLYKFLETTQLYEPWTVLKNIPTTTDRFLRFTIFIYKRLGEHEKSIDVLFNQLEDLDGSISYCSDIYHRPHSKEVGRRLLHKLLEDLLMNYQSNIDSIEKLLRLQGSKMSILQVLTALPNSFPLHKLSNFLTESLRNSQESFHDGRIASQLYKIGNVKLQDKVLQEQSQGYSIESAKQECSLCHRRLGYGVFSVEKYGQVVHYGCAQKSSN